MSVNIIGLAMIAMVAIFEFGGRALRLPDGLGSGVLLGGFLGIGLVWSAWRKFGPMLFLPFVIAGILATPIFIVEARLPMFTVGGATVIGAIIVLIEEKVSRRTEVWAHVITMTCTSGIVLEINGFIALGLWLKGDTGQAQFFLGVGVVVAIILLLLNIRLEFLYRRRIRTGAVR